MIYSLSGKILEKTGNEAVIECAGVGFLVRVPSPALGALPAVGQQGSLYTHMSVSENDVALYGFATPEERGIFLLLTSVTGIGPKVGISILSAMTPAQIALAASAGDFKAFTVANGVGPKLAQRLVLELKDKVSGAQFGGGDVTLADVAQVGGSAGAAGQALQALVALGYTQSEAASAVAPIDPCLPVSEMVRLALRQMGKK